MTCPTRKFEHDPQLTENTTKQTIEHHEAPTNVSQDHLEVAHVPVGLQFLYVSVETSLTYVYCVVGTPLSSTPHCPSDHSPSLHLQFRVRAGGAGAGERVGHRLQTGVS